MKKPFYDTLKLGILGGGQLGRMLLQKAADFNLSNTVLDPDEDAPCRYITDAFVHGSFRDYDAVYAFGKNCDLLTIEIEHVNTEALEQLEKESVLVYPSSRVIRLVQDKGAQKIFYRTHGIPTAPFQLADNRAMLVSQTREFPVIQKLRTGGYDGRGVQLLRDQDSLSGAFDEPSVVEQVVDFTKELSVIVARNTSGECKTFPVVEMEFNPEANLVEYLFAPASVSAETEARAAGIAVQVAQALETVGVLAVEMFLTKEGEILVNEIAPRPHNSGHHTIEANVTSQYEQHLRAILGLPLGDTTALSPAAMVNLLGEKDVQGPARFSGINEILRMEGVKIHLYGKKKTKPFRKMGHITILADDKETLRAKADRIKELIRVSTETALT